MTNKINDGVSYVGWDTLKGGVMTPTEEDVASLPFAARLVWYAFMAHFYRFHEVHLNRWGYPQKVGGCRGLAPVGNAFGIPMDVMSQGWGHLVEYGYAHTVTTRIGDDMYLSIGTTPPPMDDFLMSVKEEKHRLLYARQEEQRKSLARYDEGQRAIGASIMQYIKEQDEQTEES